MPSGKNPAYFYSAVCAGAPLPLFVMRSPDNTAPGICIISHKMIPLLRDTIAPAERCKWIFVDTVQGYGFPKNSWADLHMLGDPRLKDTYIEAGVTVPFTEIDDGGDFVDEELFYSNPDTQVTYDVILIASWAKFKNHILLVQAIAALKKKGVFCSTLVVGSYCVPGHMATIEEARSYEYGIREYVNRHHLPVTFGGGGGVIENQDGSTSLGLYDKSHVRDLICSARIGVLVSMQEGTARFPAECLLCDRPILLLENLQGGTRKYCTASTGLAVGALPDAVATGIAELLETAQEKTPRRSYLTQFGSRRSSHNLIRAIAQIDNRISPEIQFRPYRGDLWGTDYYNRFLPSLQMTP